MIDATSALESQHKDPKVAAQLLKDVLTEVALKDEHSSEKLHQSSGPKSFTRFTQTSVDKLPSKREKPFFFIRAVNNDNQKDLSRLVNLFRCHYGSNHPFKSVYDVDFWSDVGISDNRSGKVSVVAIQEEMFIGHLAYDFDPRAGAAQILLPAVHPEYRQHIFTMVRAFWKQIEQTAERQNWQAVFSFNPTSQPLLQLLSAKCFHSDAFALLPCISPLGENYAENNLFPSVIVMCHILNPALLAKKQIFAPIRHLQIVQELLWGVSAKPKSCQTHIPKDAPRDILGPSAHSKAFIMQQWQRFGICSLQINPPGLSNPSAALSLVERLESGSAKKNSTLVIQIALEDPHCPLICNALEDKGYRFSGVLPVIGGHDYIAYSRFENSQIKRLPLYTERSKALRDYLMRH